jgi:hypothetical protein
VVETSVGADVDMGANCGDAVEEQFFERGGGAANAIAVRETSGGVGVVPRLDGTHQIACRIRGDVGRERFVEVRMGLGHCWQQHESCEVVDEVAFGGQRATGTYCGDRAIGQQHIDVAPVGQSG